MQQAGLQPLSDGEGNPVNITAKFAHKMRKCHIAQC